MATDFVTVPILSVHPNRINLYHEVHWQGLKPRRNPAVTLKGVSKDHCGKISNVARRKINKAIQYLLFLANDKVLPDTAHGKSYAFKLAFITLTLPSEQVHSDQEIKSLCLNQFLIELRKKWKINNYFWRAEKQKNGNLHFHILVDKFVPWHEMRDVWNRIVNKLGYVDRYRTQMRDFHSGGFKVRNELLKKWEYKAQIRAYQKGKANDWCSPNSTDIHSINKIKNIEAYLSKYCTKDEQAKGLTGRLWGCNQELSDIPGGKVVVDNEISKALDSLFEKYSPNYYCGEYFTTYFISMDMLRDVDSLPLFKVLASFLNSHFHYSLQQTLPDI